MLFGARVLSLLLLLAAPAASAEMVVAVEASESARHILHTSVTIPVKPGPLTLVYPKWIPGEHGPTGPVDRMAGLRITARGKPVAWRRDTEDMYAFHDEVPAGATQVTATFDHLATAARHFSASGSASALLALISRDQLV